MKNTEKDRKIELRAYKIRLVRNLIEKAMQELGGFSKQTHQNLADTLSKPIQEYNISISKQVMWGWAQGRYLPNRALLEIMAKVAEKETLPRRFADEVLAVLAIEETPAQKAIRELGYA